MNRDIDKIADLVRGALPEARIEQLKVSHPGVDDNGLWWFSVPGVEKDVQVESSTGMCPFLIETDEQSSSEALRASTIEEAARLITEYLSGVARGRFIRLAGERFWNPSNG
jgi:hypothetical protein